MATQHWFDMEKAADLAMLSLSDEEKALFSVQIERVLAFVDTLPAASEPEGHEREITPLREDEPQVSFAREELLANAKAVSAGLIAVPCTVGGEE